ncbi:SH3 domain-containing protein [Luteimonas abyssi]|uniref:SH3 domain-containing protein n=1 Tax=Luteimonas abyssi TaxID=1247514 RepID=UPI000737CB9E|nr:SH3 domain-containing protein [Luteimonas abyssi]
MRRARILADHRPPDRPPIRIRVGEQVTLGERDTEWPDFVWTVNAAGDGGWVPASLFDRAHGTATALDDYDTRELSVAAGERVELDQALAGWWWARNAAGATGWIPKRVIASSEDHHG